MLNSSTGIVRYSPQLLGSSSGKFWVVIDCDPEIGRYCRHLYYLAHHRCDVMQRPAWKEHITVVRNELPPLEKMEAWERHNGKSFVFLWDLTVQTDGEYYWIPVQCSLALDLREELGLPRNPEYPLHLSIGHRCPRSSIG